jgi:hypothetical protein
MLANTFVAGFCSNSIAMCFEPDLFKKNHVCRLALACWQVDFEHVTVQIIAAIRPEL